MKTFHKFIFGDARDMSGIGDRSVALIVTSPPYPMIDMWDHAFGQLSPKSVAALAGGEGNHAFELMHLELDRVWRECRRVLIPGAIACINIGDAVRTIDGQFQMFANHARIIQAMLTLGFTQLPDILWRKPTNAPNKFMGSGMLPACAYVTYEHEYILIFRNGGKREFAAREEKARRRQSAYFWEERNVWFSDVWFGLVGASQRQGPASARKRSAAFPFELAYRLICMHSIYDDTVLDPFAGTGVTSVAAAAAGRHSIGVEIESGLQPQMDKNLLSAPDVGQRRLQERLQAHRQFVAQRVENGKPPKYRNATYDFGVITAQERDMLFHSPVSVRWIEDQDYEAVYEVIRSATPGMTGA